MENKVEYFPEVNRIQYEPDAPLSKLLAFRHYNADEVILGKPMHEWLRFSVCYWHTFRYQGNDPFGAATLPRPWDNASQDPMELAFARLRAAFEFMSKLGVKYWTFHDRDIAPEGATLEETNRNLDQVVALAKQLQQETGIKLLWGTANLFSHPRYMNGAATNPDAHVVAYAAAQVKKAMEVTKELGGENYVFWGGREGYQSLLNTNVRRELDHLAQFFRMAVAYKEKIGFTGQLLIEPKPKEPTKHQYDYDAQTVIGFLKTYGLDNHFKVNIEPNHTTLAGHSFEHDIEVASRYGMLGSIDSNTGDTSLGWDTDQFPMNLRDCTMVMRVVLRQGGLAPGGLNFDCKVRRESSDLEDLFIAHIGAMDTFALALRRAAAMLQDGVLDEMLRNRYLSFDNTELGQRFEQGAVSFEDCEQFVNNHGEPKLISGKQEAFEVVFNRYMG
eukprot:TRINITY_DN4907_c0_g1_i1.p1 TRINITY_DN4907_c0_g1~~TRINITY_DN4907_c0_g1_i1.p1  ORF type:complete len:444 (-),score=138.98 TRINITY_DN4907_c0_g1_i1:193-1524(-)